MVAFKLPGMLVSLVSQPCLYIFLIFNETSVTIYLMHLLQAKQFTS